MQFWLMILDPGQCNLGGWWLPVAVLWGGALAYVVSRKCDNKIKG